MLRELALRRRDRVAAVIEEDRARARGALVQREDESSHAVALSVSASGCAASHASSLRSRPVSRAASPDRQCRRIAASPITPGSRFSDSAKISSSAVIRSRSCFLVNATTGVLDVRSRSAALISNSRGHGDLLHFILIRRGAEVHIARIQRRALWRSGGRSDGSFRSSPRIRQCAAAVTLAGCVERCISSANDFVSAC